MGQVQPSIRILANMSEPRDKRRKSDLDLFVLALIKSGVSTPYTLQKEAGLSQGATIPVIQRLLQAEWIRQGQPGPRGRTEYRITAAGRKQLRTGWRILIEDGPSGDLDADLRIALLAISEGDAHAVAVQFLKQSAAKMQEPKEELSAGNESDTSAPLATLYRELRSVSVRAQLEAQATAAITMASSLPRQLSAKPERPGKAPAKSTTRKRVKRLQ